LALTGVRVNRRRADPWDGGCMLFRWILPQCE
jgi:hypothetical protein